MSDPKTTAQAKAIGLRWLEDSSLEKWFPFSAEELVRLKAERDELKQGMALAKRIIEKVGTTGIDYAYREAVEWLKKYYPGPF